MSPYSLVLAPMAGFTDEPMRALCRRLGATLTVTEMISAAALTFRDRKTATLAYLSARDVPCAVQLFGHDPDQMAEATRLICSGEYVGCRREVRPAAIDLNMGCPVRKIVTSGDGSALMQSPHLCEKITRAAVRAAEVFGIPVTVKMRAGWDKDSVNAPDVARAVAAGGASAITVHARTREQMYAPSADHTVLLAVREAVPDLPLIGNGDITDAPSYLRLTREFGCDGVAVGREALGNPWVFSEIRAVLDGASFTPPTEEERRATACALATEILSGVSPENERGAVHACRGRCAHFLRGMRGAAAIRAAINTADTREELLRALLPC